MSLAEWLVHPSARLLTLALAHFLWQGCAVALLLLVIVKVCNIRRATARYACSLIALLLMIACPLGTFAWLGNRAAGIDQITMSSSARLMTLSERASLDSGRITARIAAAQPYVLAAWLMGVALFGGRLLGGAIGVLQLRRGRQPLPHKIAPIVAQLGRRLQMDAAPLVFLSRSVAEAMAVGIVRPLVLIPAAWASEMPLDLLEAVIAHELAHLRRRDLWVNLLQRIIETVLFYHPAVWWLSRRLRIERELCADKLAVAATGNRLAYAQALQQVAEQQPAPVGPLLAAFLRGEKDMRLLYRVRNVLWPAKDDGSRLWPAGLIALALPIGLWLTSVGMGVASADDEQDRERPAKEAVRRVEILRDAERPRKVITRDGERPRKEVTRDVEGPRKPVTRVAVRKPGSEDVEEIELKILNKDDAVERKIIRQGGERKVETEIGVKGDSEARRLEELTALVERLSAQVEKLQDEVKSLRNRTSPSDRDEAAAGEYYFRLRGDVEKAVAEKARAAAERQREEARERQNEEREIRRRKPYELKEQPEQEAQLKREALKARESLEQSLREKFEAVEKLAEQKKKEAWKFADKPFSDQQRAEIEKQAQVAREMAEKAAAQARALGEKAAALAREQGEKAAQQADEVKLKALEAIKQAVEKKKELDYKEDFKEKPKKVKPDEDDDDSAQ